MGKSKTGRLGIWAVVFFCSVFQISLAGSKVEAAQTSQGLLDASDLAIPEDLGYVVETHRPTPSTSSHPALVIHIQEAHTNYEGQQHLAGILEHLIKQYGLRLILVEGGQGDVGLSYLRSYGPPETRKQVAGKYLKAGILSGEEYLDMVSDYPLILWGVEQQDLYQQNVEAFLKAEEVRDSLKPLVASVREAIELVKPKVQDPALQELDTKGQAFAKNALSLGDYVDVLGGLAKRANVPTDAYPHLARFLYVRKLEPLINRDQVQTEQRELLAALSERVSEATLDELIAQARQMKEGTLTREAFYQRLEQQATSVGLSLEAYPQLSRYVSYIKRSAQINPTTVAQELDQLATRLREALALSPIARQLSTVIEQVDLVDKLVDLRLTPQEYQRLQAMDLHEVGSAWVQFLNAQLTQQGLPNRTFPSLEPLESALPTLQQFYTVAMQRDEALVDNALAKLIDSQQGLAVLITGGFHSPQITKLLTKQGVNVVVVAPKVTQATDERLYHAVLKYKNGEGRFEDVMAIANHASGQPQ